MIHTDSHTLLIIDDEIENLKALERTLAEVVTVHTATSGKEGLEIVKREPIQVVICDQRMPEMTGLECLKEIKRIRPDMIRIILTGYTDVEDLIEAINEVGLYRYITKPWDNRELQLTVRRALEYFDLLKHNLQLTEELKGMNEELEKTVSKRTLELKEANKKLENLALIDELTQIGNSRFFWKQLRSEMERAARYKHPLSLLLIDVDHFKRYNDEFGHAAGDRALMLVAHTLKKNMRNTDFLSRYGGEEFVAILPETKKREALEMAERIRKEITKKNFPYKINKKKSGPDLTISVGVSGYLEDYKGKDAKKLVIKADQALYRAKQKGRNIVSE